MAFYYFTLVLINDVEVESNDWVGAFKGDVCVGARKWDTSSCGNGLCDIAIMGNDGSELTEGYMYAGEYPTFKIYDASADIYYDATPSEEFPWLSNSMLIAEILSATNVFIPGCTDPEACNYDEEANADDGSCEYYDPEIMCDCDETFLDVNGDCCGYLAMDECMVCNGDGSSCDGTLLVPSEYPTIQFAIDASSNGDTVLVSPDTYFEHININKEIVVGSLFLITEDTSYISQTIIDGYDAGTVVTMGTSSGKFTGFSLINGYRNDNSPSGTSGGGGMVVSGGGEVSHVRISDCSAQSGGGIKCGCSTTFDNVIIYNNSATHYGGGIWLIGGSSTFINCVIQNNTSPYGGPGVSTQYGPWGDSGGTANFYNCRIFDTVQNNSSEFPMSFNYVLFSGGIQSSSNMELNNSTMYNGGITAYSASGGDGITLTNSICWGGCSLNPSSGYIEAFYSNIIGGYAGPGILDIDPQFTDPDNGDFTLQPTSPCIDSGDPASELDPDGTRADMGAYYYDQSSSCDEGYVWIDDIELPWGPSIFISNSNCFYQSDLDVLQQFIDNSQGGENPPPPNLHPLYLLGKQIWEDGRLVEFCYGGNLLNQSCISIYRLSGEIPEVIGNLTELTILDLRVNQLTNIPSEIGNLSNLVKLQLGHNQLLDEIPSEIGQLINLFVIDLQFNNITGNIPGNIFNLPNLNLIALSNNELTGEIPPEICEVENLIYIYLDNNYLSGVIPECVCEIINFSYVPVSNRFNDNNFCPPYPDCIEDYIGYQNTSECPPECDLGDVNCDDSLNITDLIFDYNAAF